ncbi:MAG: hypothetical protein MUO63_03515 [Desulfobulbaceae bacterium]|nr:hypothetical protein [Desulfobulbaceae bacterium]
MKNVFVWIVLCFVCTACSLPIKLNNMPEEVEVRTGDSQLMNIRIERWGTTRFSGLIALQERGSGIFYVLLDATGVKLMEALVKEDGNHELVRAHGSLKDMQLPEFLSESLQKIYLIEPDTLPCSRTLLLWFCMEKSEDNRWHKYAQAGPFSLWSVDYYAESHYTKWPASSFSQPWIGVNVILTQNSQFN